MQFLYVSVFGLLPQMALVNAVLLVLLPTGETTGLRMCRVMLHCASILSIGFLWGFGTLWWIASDQIIGPVPLGMIRRICGVLCIAVFLCFTASVGVHLSPAGRSRTDETQAAPHEPSAAV